MVIYNNNYNKNNFFNLYLSISYYVYILLKNILFTVIITLSLVLLIYSKKNNNIDSFVRNKLSIVLYPYVSVTNLFNVLSTYINNAITNFRNISDINDNLKKQNFKLQLELFNFELVKEENKKLKEILNVVSTKNKLDYSISKINIISNTSFTSKVEIDSNNKMKINDLVIDKNGNLIGKIINIDNNKATVLLINDSNFKIPAILEKSMTKVIVSGNYSDILDINYFLGEKFNILENEKVYTSDDGDTIQSGILIGNIIKTKDDNVKVRISTDINKIDYVIVLHKIEEIDNTINNIINNDIENKKIIIDEEDNKENKNKNIYNTTIDDSLKKELKDI